MTQAKFEIALQEIAALRREMAPAEAKVRQLTERIEMLKVQLMAHMQEKRVKSTESIDGYSLVRVAGRTKHYIADEDAAIKWLSGLEDVDTTDFYRLDESAVVARVQSHFKETGEIVDFVVTQQGPEYIAVREAQK